MYSDATLVDDRFNSGSVVYSADRQSYILVIERDSSTQYYQPGNGYPVSQQLLMSASSQYPIHTIALTFTDKPGFITFDAQQYYNGRTVMEHQMPYLYAPLSNARFLMVMDQSESADEPDEENQYDRDTT